VKLDESPATRTTSCRSSFGAALASAGGASGAAADQYVELRSPDAIEAARDKEPYIDLRMPDSHEPSEGPGAAPDAQPVADEPSTPGAFDWPSAGLGPAAGAGLVLVLSAAGGMRRLSGPAKA
jgi:hypothetical protein